MPQSLSAVYVHAVFSTLRRQPFLTDPVLRGKMHAYLVGATRELKCPSLAIGGVEDHVHILAMLGREKSQADWIRDLKRASSKWISQSVPGFAWQAGYGIFSVSTRELETVKAYVLNQEEHHRTGGYEEELLSLLEAHGLDYDEKYLWD